MKFIKDGLTIDEPVENNYSIWLRTGFVEVTEEPKKVAKTK